MAIEQEVMSFEIEDGIEIPDRDTIQSSYPFDKLEVGQSFFVPGKTAQQMSAAKAHWRKKFPDRQWVNKKSTKEINGEVVEGVRVWRSE